MNAAARRFVLLFIRFAPFPVINPLDPMPC